MIDTVWPTGHTMAIMPPRRFDMPMENSDDAAEMDQFRESLGEFNNVITFDDGNVVEYICGEGDPPFIKYRLTLVSISEHSVAEFEAAEELAKAKKEAAE